MPLIDFPGYPSDKHKYNTHHELECPTLGKIQEETLEWVQAKTNFMNIPLDNSFWHHIADVDMARHCPSLIKFMKSINTPVREITIGVLTESMNKSGLTLHMGNPPINLKVNFPILNTEDVYTEWYDIPVEDLDAIGIRENNASPGTYVYQLEKLHDTVEATYPCLTKYKMQDHPIVFNSWFPHRVMPGPKAQYPRIMIATMPIIEPYHFLEKK